MRSPQSVEALESLGRVRLSRTFFMRDFLYSEISNFYGVPNIPDNPDLAIQNGKHLCEELLEPLQATFGRIAIRSAYRSPTVNALGNEKGHNCGSNESNAAAHIWDCPDKNGKYGAMACVVVPWFLERYEAGTDWRAMAYWVHNHLSYSQLQFFPRLCAFNIGWHEEPQRIIHSYVEPKGTLLRGTLPNPEFASYYQGFPSLARGA
ncbi:hypothetical protein ACFPAG_14520 [Vogesella sp. GCM10023246]|uniref:Peptidase M15 n=1 Tax=Vogesella oryzagri TaxID=3160864 RepID=A0ABV1M8Y8_9NEIS